MASEKKTQSTARPTPDDFRRMWENLRESVKRSYPIDRAIQDSTGIQLIGKGNLREACCPFHAEKSPSFSVMVDKGRYRCFGAGCEAGGDIFDFIQAIHGIGFREAVLLAADRAGVVVDPALREGPTPGVASKPDPTTYRYPRTESVAPPETLEPANLVPVPRGAPLPSASKWFKLWDDADRSRDPTPRLRNFLPAMVHLYRDIDGRVLCAVLRIEHPTLGKYFIPASLGKPKGPCPQDMILRGDHDAAGLAWMVLGPETGKAKPVYGMEDASAWLHASRRKILVIEGEKTRDAAKRLLASVDPNGEWLVLAPMGGGSAVSMADWTPLVRELCRMGGDPIEVHLWPDADELTIRPDGTVVDRQDVWVRRIVASLGQAAADEGVSRDAITFLRVTPPEGVASGWDLADAEAEGWTGARTLSHFETSSALMETPMLEPRKKIVDMAEETEAQSPDRLDEDRDAPSGADPFDAEWGEVLSRDEAAEAVHADAAPGVIQVDPVADPEPFNPENGIGGDDYDGKLAATLDNPYFRCLGYMGDRSFFMALQFGQIFQLRPGDMKSNYLLHLAPKSWWMRWFPGNVDRRGATLGVGWDDVIDTLVKATSRAGVWDPEREVGQGARMDGGRVVFNMGDKIYVDGEGVMPPSDFIGHYHYTVGKPCRTPDFTDPFEANAPEIRAFLKIIQRLSWRDGSKELSSMALFGWIAISVICGILRWRPHLWLDGPRGAGKSWIINHLIAPALGDYCYIVKGNSTESGLRNMLHSKALPLIFDEAEGEERDQRARMDDIIRLARHSATEGQSVVAQGISGGGGLKHYSITSTFLLCSITPQLEAAADESRFARAHLSGGLDHADFTKEIEGPASEILTETFSDRLIARMVIRARDYRQTYRLMVNGLSMLGLERRLADVYGALGTGAWLLLRDDTPKEEADVISFLGDEFDMISHIRDFNRDIVQDKDHNRLFNYIMSHKVRFDSRQMGARTELVGSLVGAACGFPSDDCVVGMDEARSVLRDLGIRPSVGGTPCKSDQIADSLLVHRKSNPIKEILEKTPYARSYADVMHQAEDVRTGDPVRFATGSKAERPLIIPLRNFGIGVEQG